MIAVLACDGAHAQAPEERGPRPVGEWDAGRVPAAGVTLPTRVYYPDDDLGPAPLVGVIHGASANGRYHPELASTLASRGFVAVVPDMPCGVTSCDHDANQRQITALLEWAAAQGGDASSPLSGRVDGSRRGLIGHSWGGLSSHLTAARDGTIGAVVLFDPNDDRGVGLAATPTIRAPVLQLLAEVPGLCNSAWDEHAVRDALTGTQMQLTVSGSGHCDPGEMDVVCSIGCGAGDRSTTPLFRRYAVAWTACVLSGDASMAAWIGGASLTSDEAAGRVESVTSAGLDALPCLGGAPADDAGAPDADAGPGAGTDAGPVGVDAGPAGGADAGGPDAGRAPDEGEDMRTPDGGCGCAVGDRGRGAGALALLVLIAAGLRRRLTRR